MKKKILLVDDVKLFIELEKTFFQRKDAFRILTAGSGKEALDIVEAEHPDLVFMDLYMPEMNGDECCRMIRQTDCGRDLPIVMVTSAGKDEDRERCEAAGCDEIITKPINRAHFLSVAKKYLEVHERKEPRYAIHLKVTIDDGGDEVLSDYSVNLNTGGLFLTSNRLLPIDSRLNVEFSLPGQEMTVCCKARVAWANAPEEPLKTDLPVGMGLQFVDISDASVGIIQDFIENNQLTPEW